jgi:PKD repeat protein
MVVASIPTSAIAERDDVDYGGNFGSELSAHIHQRSQGDSSSGGHAPFHYETDFVATGADACLDGVREITYRVWDDGSGRRELVYAGCPRVSVPGAPVPPSVAQVRDAVGIPDPTIATNPQTKTLSGMRTDYWYTGPTERAVTVTLNGFTVTATAHATSYRWQFGDGAEVTTTQPGSQEQPAATHAYRHRGDTTITLTVTWTGTFTFTGPGGITGGGDLGAQDFTSTRPLVVEEVQPVGQPAP